MSELKQEIFRMISEEIGRKATIFSGIITEYDHETKLCTVEISNPTGAGRIRLSNRSIPEAPKGIIQGSIRVGSIAIMSCPQGQYTHAEIVSIKPPGEFYGLPERVEQDSLPRGSKSVGIAGTLR